MLQPCAIDSLSPSDGLHLALGVFDGVHRGHQAVIQAAVARAKGCGELCGVLSFEPHPTKVLPSAKAVDVLMPLSTKAVVLEALGVDIFALQHFNKAFAALKADAFAAELKARLPRLESLFVGEQFRFGHGRAGDVRSLKRDALAAGFELVSVAQVHHQGRAISSTGLREALKLGRFDELNAWLGYTYFSEASVRAGHQLGRQLGFPTLNMSWTPELQPRFGVYAVFARGPSGAWCHGVANYGVRPSLAPPPRTEPLLELHLLSKFSDFSSKEDLIGQQLRVCWCAFLRPERAFESKGALQTQIQADALAANQALRSFRPEGLAFR